MTAAHIISDVLILAGFTAQYVTFYCWIKLVKHMKSTAPMRAMNWIEIFGSNNFNEQGQSLRKKALFYMSAGFILFVLGIYIRNRYMG